MNANGQAYMCTGRELLGNKNNNKNLYKNPIKCGKKLNINSLD